MYHSHPKAIRVSLRISKSNTFHETYNYSVYWLGDSA